MNVDKNDLQIKYQFYRQNDFEWFGIFGFPQHKGFKQRC